MANEEQLNKIIENLTTVRDKPVSNNMVWISKTIDTAKIDPTGLKFKIDELHQLVKIFVGEDSSVTDDAKINKMEEIARSLSSRSREVTNVISCDLPNLVPDFSQAEAEKKLDEAIALLDKKLPGGVSADSAQIDNLTKEVDAATAKLQAKLVGLLAELDQLKCKKG